MKLLLLMAVLCGSAAAQELARVLEIAPSSATAMSTSPTSLNLLGVTHSTSKDDEFAAIWSSG